MSDASPSALTLQPIGHIRTGKHVKFQALHQPSEQHAERNVLELLPGHNYEQALQDLAGFSRVWLVWWFHRTTTWRTQVYPPRGPEQARGVFATRSPHRPNPLGLTPVQLLGIEDRQLILGECDLVDGTPIFDIKPYVPAYDSFPDARAGWIEEVDALMSLPPQFTVQLSPLAANQAEWLRTQWQIDFQPRLHELLARDPLPHRTRRIKRRTATLSEIGCGAWRAFFTVEGSKVTITALDAGFPGRFLTDPLREDLPDCAAQLAFLGLWPQPPQ
ncbi:MAG: tRNA (N6-threonylcarbamoyladenosine(37)-N6)-methyltransferase TrmO [Undibacterium sp.]|nr:tRNA (N6-threonylcarbamoyladenosine(37)-N6)-methyltransferase TrmO [Opitutaceae bacterium]